MTKGSCDIRAYALYSMVNRGDFELSEVRKKGPPFFLVRDI